MKPTSYIRLIISIVLAQATGIIGSLFTYSEIPTWYMTLNKPSFNPPSWVFGPVWTTLFLLMGIAAFLVWKSGWSRIDVKKALGVYALQLVFNMTWSIVFFALHSPGWAFLNLIILWILIAWTMISFYKISKTATYLLIPYIAWVSFAGILNYTLWMLN